MAPLKADLEVTAERRQARRLGEVLAQWLLAQHRQTAGERRLDRSAVQMRWGGHHDRVGLRERVGEADRPTAGPSAHLRNARVVRVDQQNAHLGHGAQQGGVHPADAARADDGDLHATAARVTARRAYSTTRLPIAAASEAGSHDVSCSTMSHPS
jgi:hypothetical protein